MELMVTAVDKKGITELEEVEKLTEEEKEQIALSKDIFHIVFSKISQKCPMLYPFLQVFELTPVKERLRILETDGRHLFYTPERILEYFRSRQLVDLEMQVVHATMHGLLGHFSLRETVQKTDVLDEVMDFSVKRILKQLGYRFFQWDEEEDQEYESYSTGELFQIYSRDQKFKWNTIRWYCPELYGDHKVWNREKEYHTLLQLPDGQKGKEALETLWNSVRELVFGNGITSDGMERTIEARLQGQLPGQNPGSNSTTETAAEANYRSYRALLEELAKERESNHQEEDTIDKMLYNYGFEMYGNIALVEPEEDVESKRLGTLAIAIDTSGSCEGALMRQFLRETKNIIEDLRGRISFEKLVLMQCDMTLQKEEWFESAADLPLEDTFQTYGYGGTSFVPVFERLEELVRDQQESVDGLLYFTDGFGIFPQKKPDYPVIFLMPEESNDRVPVWSRRLVIQEEGKK